MFTNRLPISLLLISYAAFGADATQWSNLIAGATINATAWERFRNEGGNITAGALLGGVGVGAGIASLNGGGYRTVCQR